MELFVGQKGKMVSLEKAIQLFPKYKENLQSTNTFLSFPGLIKLYKENYSNMVYFKIKSAPYKDRSNYYVNVDFYDKNNKFKDNKTVYKEFMEVFSEKINFLDDNLFIL
jgi:hypothetical protein